MYENYETVSNNNISEEMGSNYISISSVWDSDVLYDTENISLEMELKLINAEAIYNSLSMVEGQLLSYGQKITFKDGGKTYMPFINGMKLPMGHRLAISSYMLKHCPLINKEITKDGTIYTISYKDKDFNVFIDVEAKYTWYSIATKESKEQLYYNNQFKLRTNHESLVFELEVDHPVYGDQITGFPMKLDELSDELDDAIDLLMRCSRIPELKAKIDEAKKLLDLI